MTEKGHSENITKLRHALELLAEINPEPEGPVKIRTKQKCPKCGGKFERTSLGLRCPKCLTTPSRYYVYLSWKGRKIKIYSFKDGQPLSSWDLAKRAQQLIEHEIESGAFDPSKWVKSDARKFLFEKQWARWFDIKNKKMERGELSPGYLDQIKSYQRRIIAFFKNKDVREIKRADITDFLTSLEEDLSPKTISNILGLLQNFLNFLKTEEVIDRVPRFPEIRIPKNEPEVLSKEEQAIILGYIQENLPEHFPIMAFILRQGVRPGEACALFWEDIDLAKGFVWIRKTFSARKLKETTKGRKDRIIPLDPEIHALLKEHVKKVAPFPKNFVFVQPNGPTKTIR